MTQEQMTLGNILHQGSVKDIYQVSKAGQAETLAFKFSDRYSVFDWGEMPDQIEGKGATLAFMGGLFFRWLEKGETWKRWQPSLRLDRSEEELLDRLKKNGLKHHYLGGLSGDKNTMVVKKVKVPTLPQSKGHYDYSIYRESPTNTLVPLEVIFRFGVPEGSSLLKRVGDKEYLQVLELKKAPNVGDWFSKPIIEFSTKLESTDRYLGYEEAQSISGLSDLEFTELHGMTTLVAMRLSDLFSNLGIRLWDGKFEWAFGEIQNSSRELVLVDSIGPDELRLSYNNHKLSKEFLRSFYRQSSWLKSVEQAKERAKKEQTINWKQFVPERPAPLSPLFKKAAKGLYLSLGKLLAEELEDLASGESDLFKEAPTLSELAQMMDEITGAAK